MGNHRDACIKACGRDWLVLTTDNSAAIGQAKQDLLPVDPYLVAQSAARVALMEAVALGATPLAASSTLSFDYGSKQGQRITAGILDQLAGVGLGASDLTGSCETNFPASFTCLGLTVVSLATRERLLLGKVEAGDCCYLLGLPLVGLPVLQAWRTLLTPPELQQLAGWFDVHELVPIGSHGIKSELDGVAAASELQFHQRELTGVALDQSAGPATCVLVVGASGLEERLRQFGQAVTVLGTLEARS